MNRRKFNGNALAAAAALSMAGMGSIAPSGAARGATRQSTPELVFYLALWRSSSTSRPIPWNDSSPQRVAEAFTHTVWSYFQQPELFHLFMNRNKATIIGHTSILAVMHHGSGEKEKLLFSNSGKLDRGVYRNPVLPGPGSSEGFPDREPYKSNCECFVPASVRLVEVLAGHSESGFWEDFKKYKKRVRERKRPALKRVVLTGNEAVRTFELMKETWEASQPRDGTNGAPVHFGLNARLIRLPGAFDKPVRPTRHQIGGRRIAIPGGCSNAIAAVLEACRLSHLVPRRRASFRLPIALDRFRDIELPIIVNPQTFDSNGRARSKVLLAELERVPQRWGSGETLEFTDPNHWHATLGQADEDWHAFLADLHG